MGLFSFSRGGIGSNQKASVTADPEKYDVDWFAPARPLHKVSSGLLHAESDQVEAPRDTGLDQSGHTSSLVSSSSGRAVHSPAPEPTIHLRLPATLPSAADSSLAAQKVDGGIGEFPVPPFRSPSRKRFSRTFFAFSSNRKSHHVRTSNIHEPQSQQFSPFKAHLADPNTLPSPLRTDTDDYYYCNYSPVTPCRTSPPAIPHLDTSNTPSLLRRRSTRSQRRGATLDSDSQQSSPLNYFSSDTGTHPFAGASAVSPYIRNPTVYPDSPVLPSGIDGGLEGQLRRNEPEVLTFPIPPPQPLVITEEKRNADEIRPSKPAGILRSSFSVPNLSSVGGVTLRQPGTRVARPAKRGKDIFLTAGNWCDTIIFPRPRLKAKHGSTATSQPIISPLCTPVPADGTDGITPTFPLRPDVASSTVVADPVQTTARSPSPPAEARVVVSALDVPRNGLLPPSVVDNLGGRSGQAGLPLPSPPPPSLTTVLEEREDLERLREQWRIQATKSLGNKHARFFSRSRSKSLSEKRIHKKGNVSNLEYLAARALLGSQSTAPKVLVNKSSDTTSHSHSHSHSTTYSHVTHSTPTLLHSSQSRSQSHGHSHSLSTSHSSKSLRDPFQHHAHSRSEFWGKAALVKAGTLCGFGQDVKSGMPPDDHMLPMQLPPEETVPGGTGPPANIKDVDEAEGFLPSPNAEPIGIAISSPSAIEEHISPGHNFSIPDHPFAKGSPPSRLQPLPSSSQGSTHHHIRTVSEYAGPHPSALDLKLPITATSDVSLRHRLPPRPAAHLAVPSISHPYGAASTTAIAGGTGQARQRSHSHTVSPRISTLADCALGPHVSVTSAEFEQFGVGKALVYSVLPRQGKRA